MLITVQRKRKTFDGLFGTLTMNDNFFTCFTVENFLNAIAAGIYSVKQQYSPHFNRMMPHIIVPDRTVLMFHWANYPKQLLGCIGLGDQEEPDAVDDSIVTFNKFDILTKALPNLQVQIKDIHNVAMA